MTRIEYLKREVKKYSELTLVAAALYLVHFAVLLFLIIHMIVYWGSHDQLTSMQILKYSFGKFWFLYAYVILFIFFKEKLDSFSHLYRSFAKQLKEEEKKNETT